MTSNVVEFPTTIGSIFHLIARHLNGEPKVDLDDVRAEMRRYLTATSPDAKQALADIASTVRSVHAYPLSEDGTAILVDTEDPAAPDGYGRTYYLTLTEIPR